MSLTENWNPTVDDYVAMFDRFGTQEREIVLGKLQQKQDDAPPRRRRTFEELCGIWDTPERRADTERMVQAIHEGRLIGTEREPL